LIPFVDLKAQYRSIKSEVDTAITRVLESGEFALGSEVAAFEEEFAAYCQAKHAVAVNSGTSALHLALLAAGVGPGDEVITVPFTFVATAAAILYTGARPVFVDIEPHSFTMDVNQIEPAITPHTKAILPVHLYGQPADMDPILEIAGQYGLRVIEDAAQAHGAEYKGRRVGAVGDIGCFSFYPGKNLGAYGEGGLLVTNHAEYAETAQMLRDWGQKEKYRHMLRGYNYRMDNLQGSILRVKLRHLNKWTDERVHRARGYNELLSSSEVTTPCEMAHGRHVYHLYVIRALNRDAVQHGLFRNSVQTGIHYPIPVHLQKAYADLGYRPGDFPASEQASSEVLSLPMFPELSNGQQEQVALAIGQSAYRQRTKHRDIGPSLTPVALRRNS
jgi:dTDP-4-amino-4,6-dideoxygalactose transaminase